MLTIEDLIFLRQLCKSEFWRDTDNRMKASILYGRLDEMISQREIAFSVNYDLALFHEYGR